jgi:hypothetical protein
MNTKDINKVLDNRINAVFIANVQRNRSYGFPCIITKAQRNGRFLAKFIYDNDKLGSALSLEARAFHSVTDQDFTQKENS